MAEATNVRVCHLDIRRGSDIFYPPRWILGNYLDILDTLEIWEMPSTLTFIRLEEAMTKWDNP